jgi:lipopolysaccharide export system protein LptA
MALGGSPLSAAPALDSRQPIEITADTLEVLQNERKAIFSGNVVAQQGNIRMQAARMLVFYTGEDSQQGASVKGISRIEADGNVFFASPTETVKGDRAIYEVSREQITMTGNVVLTRDKNILKGTQLTYNLATGKSVLGSGGAAGGGRVKGLFVPNQTKGR